MTTKIEVYQVLKRFQREHHVLLIPRLCLTGSKPFEYFLPEFNQVIFEHSKTRNAQKSKGPGNVTKAPELKARTPPMFQGKKAKLQTRMVPDAC